MTWTVSSLVNYSVHCTCGYLHVLLIHNPPSPLKLVPNSWHTKMIMRIRGSTIVCVWYCYCHGQLCTSSSYKLTHPVIHCGSRGVSTDVSLYLSSVIGCNILYVSVCLHFVENRAFVCDNNCGSIRSTEHIIASNVQVWYMNDRPPVYCGYDDETDTHGPSTGSDR